MLCTLIIVGGGSKEREYFTSVVVSNGNIVPVGMGDFLVSAWVFIVSVGKPHLVPVDIDLLPNRTCGGLWDRVLASIIYVSGILGWPEM